MCDGDDNTGRKNFSRFQNVAQLAVLDFQCRSFVSVGRYPMLPSWTRVGRKSSRVYVSANFYVNFYVLA